MRLASSAGRPQTGQGPSTRPRAALTPWGWRYTRKSRISSANLPQFRESSASNPRARERVVRPGRRDFPPRAQPSRRSGPSSPAAPRARCLTPAARDAAPTSAPHPRRAAFPLCARSLCANDTFPKWTCLGRRPDPLFAASRRATSGTGTCVSANTCAGSRQEVERVTPALVFHPAQLAPRDPEVFTLRFSDRESESDIGGCGPGEGAEAVRRDRGKLSSPRRC